MAALTVSSFLSDWPLGNSALALVGHGNRASVSRKEMERARCALWCPGGERQDRSLMGLPSEHGFQQGPLRAC